MHEDKEKKRKPSAILMAQDAEKVGFAGVGTES